MQHIKFWFLGLLIAAAAGTFIYSAANLEHTDTTHLHAAFRVYVDGEALDFSGIEYMKIMPCNGDRTHERLSAEEEQLEKAHLHDGVGDVVHVHRAGATWGDLFQNIHYTFDRPVTGFRAGSGDPISPDVVTFDTEITAYDRVYFVVGDGTSLGFSNELVPSVDHIKEVEAAGESCGS